MFTNLISNVMQVSVNKQLKNFQTRFEVLSPHCQGKGFPFSHFISLRNQHNTVLPASYGLRWRVLDAL